MEAGNCLPAMTVAGRRRVWRQFGSPCRKKKKKKKGEIIPACWVQSPLHHWLSSTHFRIRRFGSEDLLEEIMESERSLKEMVPTQVGIGGFDDYVSAKMLCDYLQEAVGSVWRCRLKKSSTPPESSPDFFIGTSDIVRSKEKVQPHAFVHFGMPDSARLALNAAGRGDLVMDNKLLKVSLGPENPHTMNQRRRNVNPYKLFNVRLEVGALVSQDDFFVSWRGPSTGVDFVVDPFNGMCHFIFTKDVAFCYKDTTNRAAVSCNLKLEFLVRDINEIKQYNDTTSLIILLQLDSSPLLYYRTADDDAEDTVSFNLLDDDDPWIRTTDFSLSGAIGRCNMYRIIVPPRNGPTLKKAMKYFQGSRIPDESPTEQLRVVEEPDFGVPVTGPFFCIQKEENVSFPAMFLVNAVMHKGIINQHQLSDRFFELLRTHPEEVNVIALKHICSYRQPVFDAYRSLSRVLEWVLENPKILMRPRQLDNVVEVRRLVITPTRAYCLLPSVELSNRVLRHYKEIVDRFMRVTFMDEGMQTLNLNVLNFYVAPIVRDITSNGFPQKTTVFKRIRDIVSQGFYLCGRKYSFLAFSSNQLRDRSAWFFAESRYVNVESIIAWMGKFKDKNVAKCTARMGQCFSSTYATVEVPRTEVKLKLRDIKRNGHVFSDGIGMMTPDLASEVAEKLHLREPPSAYQIRYAGCKGVIACWPGKNDKGIRLSLRESMDKFDSNHTILEICSWTRFQPGFLNRQIVTLLSALDVPDEIFWEMQQTVLCNLNQMTEDIDAAFDVLTSSCDEQGNTAAIMLSAGFKPQTEPHLRGMLNCIRAAQLWGLREKARIFVPSGRWLMGCFDENGVLEEGQCFIQASIPSLENCFTSHGSAFACSTKNLQVIKGFVVIAKNPCLHPGDVRVLEAVDAPDLHHLVDCVVFPQKGDRPHTNEASGSDLDGDLYFVTWDENLVPPSKRSSMAMDYAPAKENVLPHKVSRKDIVEFFTRYMVNETLGTICNAHVVHADLSEYGAHDEKCLELAERAASAVDFPKTGQHVTMPAKLKPKMYPDFMGKEPYQSYRSKKILGRLYRQIKDIYSEEIDAPSEQSPVSKETVLYNKDLEVSGSETFVADAWAQKCSYDDQLSGILGQYKVNREEEVVTGHIWSMPKNNSRKQGELQEKLRHAYSSLKKEFRHIFNNVGPGFDELSNEEKNKVYEMKASAWYQVTYHPTWVEKSLEMQEPGGNGENLMLSFCWIAVDYLARIKIRCSERRNLDPAKPVNSLVNYLSGRI